MALIDCNNPWATDAPLRRISAKWTLTREEIADVPEQKYISYSIRWTKTRFGWKRIRVYRYNPTWLLSRKMAKEISDEIDREFVSCIFGNLLTPRLDQL